MNRNKFALGPINFAMLALGMVIVIVGFLLMAGPGSTEEFYNPDIFSARRIKIAPAVCFVGFVSMIVAILYVPKASREAKELDAKIAETPTTDDSKKEMEQGVVSEASKLETKE